MENVRKFLEEIKIYDCGLTKMRLGNKRDGGYVVLKELCEKTSTLCSCGIGSDVGFELDFVNRFLKAQVLLFDYIIDNLPVVHERFLFFKQKVNSKCDVFQYTFGGNALLKMDIEWDEWNTFLGINEEKLNGFNQIVCEFHIIHVESRQGLSPYFHAFYQNVLDKINNDLFMLYYEVLRKLNKYFYIFHIHANNSLPVIEVQGYQFPPLLELSFVRKDLVSDVEEMNSCFPVPGLDFPNKTDRPDVIGYLPFGVS